MKVRHFRTLVLNERGILAKKRKRGSITQQEYEMLLKSLVAYVDQEPNGFTLCMMTSPDGNVRMGGCKLCWKDDVEHKYDRIFGEQLAFIRAIESDRLIKAPIHHIDKPEKKKETKQLAPGSTPVVVAKPAPVGKSVVKGQSL